MGKLGLTEIIFIIIPIIGLGIWAFGKENIKDIPKLPPAPPKIEKDYNKQLLHNRNIIIAYFIWIFLNFICLMVSDKIGSDVFYPFETNTSTVFKNGKMETIDGLNHAYDFSEFVVYIVSPLFLIFIYNFIKLTTPRETF